MSGAVKVFLLPGFFFGQKKDGNFFPSLIPYFDQSWLYTS